VWLLFALLLAFPASAVDLEDLTIAASRIPDWETAFPGVEGGIPDISGWTETASAAACDGVTNDRSTIQGEIDAAADNTIIRLPAGTCDIGSDNLNLKSNVVLAGQGMNSTTIYADETDEEGTWTVDFCNYSVIHFCGGVVGSNLAISSGYTKGSASLVMASTTGLAVDDWIRIYQDNDPSQVVDPPPNTGPVLSYIAQIDAIDGSTITIDRPLRHDLNATYNPRVNEIAMMENAGLEDLKVELSTSATMYYQPLLLVERAINSWTRRVWFYNGPQRHIKVTDSARFTARNNKFERLIWFYEAGGNGGVNGYSVILEQHAHDNLITNNVFLNSFIHFTLSHGSSGNVFSYNYAPDVTQCGHAFFLHGSYTHSNLLEGNDTDCRFNIDSNWGPQGPWNTIYRNRTLNATERSDGRAPLGGLRSEDPANGFSKIADKLNIMLNSLVGVYRWPTQESGTNGCSVYPEDLVPCIDFDSPHTFNSNVQMTDLHMERNLYTDGVNLMWIATPEADTTLIGNLNGTSSSWGLNFPASLYQTTRPDYMGCGAWPIAGADVDDTAGTLTKLPAQTMYESGDFSDDTCTAGGLHGGTITGGTLQ
jgi:hypothetical protein